MTSEPPATAAQAGPAGEPAPGPVAIPGPSPVGTTLARMAGAGMAAVLVAVSRPTSGLVLPIFGIGFLWLLATAYVVIQRGWTRDQSRVIAVVDLAALVAAIAVTGGDGSNATGVLWLAPLAWAVVADAAIARLLLVLGGLVFLGFWIAGVAVGHDDAVRTLGTFGSSYLAAVAITFVALRLRSQADEQRDALARARSALTRELGQVERDERERLAVQVHDGPLQAIISARQDLVDHLEGDADALLIGVATLDESIVSLRGIATDLFPDQDGGSTVREQLGSIVAAWEARHAFRVRLTVDEHVGEGSDALLVAMVAELVGNAAKHAAPSLVSVRVRDEAAAVVLEVADDGAGMTHEDRVGAEQRGHIGLRSLDRRVRAMGGSWQVRSAPGRGTAVRVELPR